MVSSNFSDFSKIKKMIKVFLSLCIEKNFHLYRRLEILKKIIFSHFSNNTNVLLEQNLEMCVYTIVHFTFELLIFLK